MEQLDSGRVEITRNDRADHLVISETALSGSRSS